MGLPGPWPSPLFMDRSRLCASTYTSLFREADKDKGSRKEGKGKRGVGWGEFKKFRVSSCGPDQTHWGLVIEVDPLLSLLFSVAKGALVYSVQCWVGITVSSCGFRVNPSPLTPHLSRSLFFASSRETALPFSPGCALCGEDVLYSAFALSTYDLRLTSHVSRFPGCIFHQKLSAIIKYFMFSYEK